MMASYHSACLVLAFSLSLLLFLRPSLSDVPPAAPTPPDTACNATPFPTFCKSIMPPRSGGGPANLYDYGRFSVARSLSSARKFSNLVDRYLARRSALSTTAVRALEDCQLLSDLNVDFLSSAGAALNATPGGGLLDPQADRVQTLLSALLTNQQTCLDGLQATSSAWSVRNGLSAPLSNDTKLYSVSLALFSRAWVPKKRKSQQLRRGGFTKERIPRRPHKVRHGSGRGLLFHEVEVGEDGGLPLAMSDRNRELFESRSGRRVLLQSSSSDGQVVAVSDVVVVGQDGSGNFTTVGEAVASAPEKTGEGDGYYLIYVAAGVYEEYVTVGKNKRYVMMVGDGINQTVITGNRSVVDGWTTFNSATFAVVGQGFVAMNITFRNTAGAAKHQAVAVRNGADLSTFYTCSFEGYQDTLYAHSLRHFYSRCDVYGTVDFVFGNAAAVFQACNLYARLPMPGQTIAVTAQGRTDPNQNTGTSLHNCTFLPAPDLAAAGGPAAARTYLGRPWKLYSRTVVMQSFLGGHVDPAGWLPWDGDFALATLYYAEYNNTGPGAATGGRVTWPGYHSGINSTDAGNFTVASFILGDDWLPLTGVSYLSGLL